MNMHSLPDPVASLAAALREPGAVIGFGPTGPVEIRPLTTTGRRCLFTGAVLGVVRALAADGFAVTVRVDVLGAMVRGEMPDGFTVTYPVDGEAAIGGRA